MATPSQALTWFVDGDIGSDANSGSSAAAGPSVTGIAGATDTTSTVALDSGEDLSGVVSGDMIRLVGETSGFNGGELYEILTINDGADTITVNPTPSSTTSDITYHIGGALKTLIAAQTVGQNSNSADVTVFVKNSVTYTETPFFNGAQGTVTKPLRWKGYGTTVEDTGIVTVDAESSRQYAIRTDSTTQLVIENFHGKNATIRALGNGSTSCTFRNCRASNSLAGLRIGNASVAVGCYCSGNTANGFDTASGDIGYFNCIAEANGEDGFTFGNGVVYQCLSISNAATGIEASVGSSNPLSILSCTVDGDAKDSTFGIDINGTPAVMTVGNNLVYDCATGMRTGNSTGTDNRRRPSFGNLVNSNTADYDQWSTNDGEQTGAPVFVNEGTDYGLQEGSPGADDAIGPDWSEYGGGSGWITSVNAGKAIGAMPAPDATGADFPVVGDVETGVTYAASTKTGTFDAPTEPQVEEGIGFGAGGTEFTGELVGGEILPFLSV